MRPAIILFSILVFSTSALGADVQTAAPAKGGRGLGDVLWTLDIFKATGDLRHMGVEFDGVNFWVTGAHDFTISYIYEISPGGALVNKYPQPPGNWGFWGWRDLAWDGQYLYAGDDSSAPGLITQIDTANGQPTGTYYGPYPMVPCRALAWDPLNVCFWTASWSSLLVQCFLDNTYNTHPNPGFTIVGAAVEESDPNHPMLWWISMDGNGTWAVEFDLKSFAFTGRTFELAAIGGVSYGACAYDAGGGQWILVVCQDDFLVAYDLDTLNKTLMVDTYEIDMAMGGTVNFDLAAGAAHALRDYGLFGSSSGSEPGIPLPGGTATLPINWDYFTTLLIQLNPPGFFGQLDPKGDASASLYVPPFNLGSDITLTFAYALQGKPWDFASNPVDVLLNDPDPPALHYDDGTSENLLGYTSGGELCWMHVFDVGTWTPKIESISLAFGCPIFPGYGPGNGAPCTVYIWEDPGDDLDPVDAVLLDSVATTVQNVDTDIFNLVPLNAPVSVTGTFWIGCSQQHAAGQYVAPIDMDNMTYGYEAWTVGTPGGSFDPVIPNNSFVAEMSTIGFPNYFLLRANSR